MTMAARPVYCETGLGWPDAMAPAGSAETSQATGELALEAGLGFRLGRAHRLLRAAWEQIIADLGLSPPQAALLRAVAQQPGCGLRELARRVQTDAMNAKRLADHLERAGAVGARAGDGAGRGAGPQGGEAPALAGAPDRPGRRRPAAGPAGPS